MKSPHGRRSVTSLTTASAGKPEQTTQIASNRRATAAIVFATSKWTVVRVTDERSLERLGGCAGPDKTKALFGLSVFRTGTKKKNIRWLSELVNMTQR